MTIEQVEKTRVELGKRGLYVINESALKAVRGLQRKYNVHTSLEEVREITYAVIKRHKTTLSDEVAYIRRG